MGWSEGLEAVATEQPSSAHHGPSPSMPSNQGWSHDGRDESQLHEAFPSCKAAATKGWGRAAVWRGIPQSLSGALLV